MRIWQWLVLILVSALGFTVARSEAARTVLLWSAFLLGVAVVLLLLFDAAVQYFRRLMAVADDQSARSRARSKRQ